MPKYFTQISIALFFIAFITFIAYAPLGQGVPCVGNVVIDTKRKVIQHQSGGKIEEVLVKEGQFVEINQVLIRLNDLNVKAKLEEVKQHYYGSKFVDV